MILNGNTIKNLAKDKILIENINKNNIHSSSYDVTVGNYILKFKDTKKTIDLINGEAVDKMYKKVSIKDGYEFKPGECILVMLE